MKKIFIILMILVLLSTDITFASEISDIETTFNMLDYNDLNTLTQTENFSFTKLFSDLMSGQLEFSIGAIFTYTIQKLFSETILNIALIRNILIICILSAFFSNISDTLKSSEASKLAFYTFYISIVTILYNLFYLAYQITFELINSIYNFCVASIPLISSSVLLSGNPVFLTAINPLLWFFTNTVIIFVKTIILPFILCIASLDIINRISDKDILSNFCATGKQLISWSLKLLSGLFISFLALIRITAPAYDTLVSKTAKMGIATVPVVGSSLSSAFDTAVFLGKSTKNGALVALLIALCVYISIYFIKLCSFVIIYKISAIAIEPITDKKISKSISLVGDYVGYFIAAAFFTCLMFVFSVLTIISL